MSTTAERMRAWRGPAILSFGFRPFFLGAAIWAAVAMALWIPALTGALDLPTRFDAASWHSHEFLFGYLSEYLGLSFLAGLRVVPAALGGAAGLVGAAALLR